MIQLLWLPDSDLIWTVKLDITFLNQLELRLYQTPPSSGPTDSGSSISISTENSPVTVQQESPQSVGMELASIASDSHLVLDRYWRDSFDNSSSSSSSN